MNCLDYRRELLAEGDETASMQSHRTGCPQCRAFYADHQSMEQDLRRALEVPVPPGLEARLVERVFSAEPIAATNPARRRWLYAAAAAAAGVIAGGTYLWIDRDDPLALACIQWVIKEEAKSIMMGAMPREEAVLALQSVLPLERIEQVGQIRHIAPCPFDGGTAYHVVLSAGGEKLTLLVMPTGNAARRARALHEGMFASVMPVGDGWVGVIGPSKAIVTGVLAQLSTRA